MIEGAEKAGKPLASITLPDGTKLDFTKPEPAAPRYRRRSRQTRISGRSHCRVFRLANILHLEERRHATHAARHPRTLSRRVWRTALRATASGMDRGAA